VKRNRPDCLGQIALPSAVKDLGADVEILPVLAAVVELGQISVIVLIRARADRSAWRCA